MKRYHKYLLAGLAGLLMSLSFPPYEYYFLGFVMFLPLLKLIESSNRGHFWIYYLCFFIYQVSSNWWIAAIQEGKDPWLVVSGIALAIGHPFFLIVPILLLHFIKKNYFPDKPEKIIWLFPIVWTSFEWVHSLTDFSYPWLSIGYTQIYNSAWVQMADIGGVWLIGLVLSYCNVLIYKYLISFRSTEIMGPKRLKILFPLAILIILPLVYGLSRLSHYDHDTITSESPVIDIALIQPNINPWEKWDGLTAEEQIKIHQDIIDSLSRNDNIDLAIWSESVITGFSYKFNVKHDFSILRTHMSSYDYSLMTGFADIYFYDESDDIPAIAKQDPNDSTRFYDTFNAATLLDVSDPDEEIADPQIYRKMKLTPFAERFPHAETFWFMRDLVKWGVGISGWQKGREQKNLIYEDSVKIAPIICIESIYPDFVANFTEQGANIFTIITNDGWYDFTPGPEQHYQIARMRAIENRRYIARVANTGVSGLIGPSGADLERVEQYTRGGKIVEVPIMQGSTVYSRLGGYIGLLTSIISLFIIISSLVIRIKARGS